jgi:hypothetical protein
MEDTPAKTGAIVQAQWTGTGTKKILLIAHMDTVYLRGMLKDQPFRIQGDRAYGLGIADNKQGVALIVHTVAMPRLYLATPNHGMSRRTSSGSAPQRHTAQHFAKAGFGRAGQNGGGGRSVNPRSSSSVELQIRRFPLSMHRLIAFSAALVLPMVVGTATAAPASSLHAAACVAALKAQEGSLAEAVKAGTGVEDELLKVVRSGIAIIGTQYFAGLREAEARQLLKAAEEDFQTLLPAAAAERQAECLQEGYTLYEHASALERTLITTAAQRRIKRLTSA